MAKERSRLSLSGIPSLLIALGGGCHREMLKTSEKYNVDLNKWSVLAPLNSAREWPGSILLKSSMIAFCFSGYGFGNTLNSIESLEPYKEWE